MNEITECHHHPEPNARTADTTHLSVCVCLSLSHDTQTGRQTVRQAWCLKWQGTADGLVAGGWGEVGRYVYNNGEGGGRDQHWP
mmetsp:Transcript_10231/g.29568  ORF Transcript_10231/g.29568 Transcript_10231/m.29568 type:complete len:84 (-) Transcript_10231:307-558(-)